MQYQMGIGLPEVTKNLLIINVLMFIGQVTFPMMTEYLALFVPGMSEHFQPYQIVTHMFLHGGAMHLFFNMFGLYMFGAILERAFGPKRFLLFYIVTGLGAALLHSAVQYYELANLTSPPLPVEHIEYYRQVSHAVGASGAIFGLLAGFGMLYPNRMIMMIFPPIPMKAKYFVIFYGALELYLGISGSQTGVAHFAHLGGAIFGALMILFWRSRGKRF